MFTGLIMETGRVADIKRDPKGAELTIEAHVVLEGVAHGDSIAVNGICLTVTKFTDHSFSAYASSETIDVTTLKGWEKFHLVNLETSLTPSTKMGGHMVQGHVDAMGEVKKITNIGESYDIQLGFTEELVPYIVAKGSIALDGISLTVNTVDIAKRIFSIRIIPTTFEKTNIQTWSPGDPVNIETDIVGRYVVHYLQNFKDIKTPLTMDILKEKGY